MPESDFCGGDCPALLQEAAHRAHGGQESGASSPLLAGHCSMERLDYVFQQIDCALAACTGEAEKDALLQQQLECAAVMRPLLARKEEELRALEEEMSALETQAAAQYAENLADEGEEGGAEEREAEAEKQVGPTESGDGAGQEQASADGSASYVLDIGEEDALGSGTDGASCDGARREGEESDGEAAHETEQGNGALDGDGDVSAEKESSFEKESSCEEDAGGKGHGEDDDGEDVVENGADEDNVFKAPDVCANCNTCLSHSSHVVVEGACSEKAWRLFSACTYIVTVGPRRCARMLLSLRECRLQVEHLSTVCTVLAQKTVLHDEERVLQMLDSVRRTFEDGDTLADAMEAHLSASQVSCFKDTVYGLLKLVLDAKQPDAASPILSMLAPGVAVGWREDTACSAIDRLRLSPFYRESPSLAVMPRVGSLVSVAYNIDDVWESQAAVAGWLEDLRVRLETWSSAAHADDSLALGLLARSYRDYQSDDHVREVLSGITDRAEVDELIRRGASDVQTLLAGAPTLVLAWEERQLPVQASSSREEEVIDAASGDVADDFEEAAKLKSAGNAAFGRGENEAALGLYEQALEAALEPVIFLNRAAVLLKMDGHDKCVDDCLAFLGTPWSEQFGDRSKRQLLTCKAFFRLATALFGLDKPLEAARAMEQSIAHCTSPSLLKSLRREYKTMFLAAMDEFGLIDNLGWLAPQLCSTLAPHLRSLTLIGDSTGSMAPPTGGESGTFLFCEAHQLSVFASMLETVAGYEGKEGGTARVNLDCRVPDAASAARLLVLLTLATLIVEPSSPSLDLWTAVSSEQTLLPAHAHALREHLEKLTVVVFHCNLEEFFPWLALHDGNVYNLSSGEDVLETCIAIDVETVLRAWTSSLRISPDCNPLFVDHTTLQHLPITEQSVEWFPAASRMAAKELLGSLLSGFAASTATLQSGLSSSAGAALTHRAAQCCTCVTVTVGDFQMDLSPFAEQPRSGYYDGMNIANSADYVGLVNVMPMMGALKEGAELQMTSLYSQSSSWEELLDRSAGDAFTDTTVAFKLLAGVSSVEEVSPASRSVHCSQTAVTVNGLSAGGKSVTVRFTKAAQVTEPETAADAAEIRGSVTELIEDMTYGDRAPLDATEFAKRTFPFNSPQTFLQLLASVQQLPYDSAWSKGVLQEVIHAMQRENSIHMIGLAAACSGYKSKLTMALHADHEEEQSVEQDEHNIHLPSIVAQCGDLTVYFAEVQYISPKWEATCSYQCGQDVVSLTILAVMHTDVNALCKRSGDSLWDFLSSEADGAVVQEIDSGLQILPGGHALFRFSDTMLDGDGTGARPQLLLLDVLSCSIVGQLRPTPII